MFPSILFYSLFSFYLNAAGKTHVAPYAVPVFCILFPLYHRYLLSFQSFKTQQQLPPMGESCYINLFVGSAILQFREALF